MSEEKIPEGTFNGSPEVKVIRRETDKYGNPPVIECERCGTRTSSLTVGGKLHIDEGGCDLSDHELRILEETIEERREKLEKIRKKGSEKSPIRGITPTQFNKR